MGQANFFPTSPISVFFLFIHIPTFPRTDPIFFPIIYCTRQRKLKRFILKNKKPLCVLHVLCGEYQLNCFKFHYDVPSGFH
jgi:hypothetical protein